MQSNEITVQVTKHKGVNLNDKTLCRFPADGCLYCAQMVRGLNTMSPPGIVMSQEAALDKTKTACKL